MFDLIIHIIVHEVRLEGLVAVIEPHNAIRESDDNVVLIYVRKYLHELEIQDYAMFQLFLIVHYFIHSSGVEFDDIDSVIERFLGVIDNFCKILVN